MDVCTFLTQFRDRAATVPRPTRLSGYTGGGEGGRGGGQGKEEPSDVGLPSDQEQPSQRQQYLKQISTPEMSRQSTLPSHVQHGQVQTSSSVPPSFTGSPSNDFRYHSQFSHPGRQGSEYGNFQTELSVIGTEHILLEQSERFANYESEAMKKKEIPREFWCVCSSDPLSPSEPSTSMSCMYIFPSLSMPYM